MDFDSNFDFLFFNLDLSWYARSSFFIIKLEIRLIKSRLNYFNLHYLVYVFSSCWKNHRQILSLLLIYYNCYRNFGGNSFSYSNLYWPFIWLYCLRTFCYFQRLYHISCYQQILWTQSNPYCQCCLKIFRKFCRVLGYF